MNSSDKFSGRSMDKTAVDEWTDSLKAKWKFITFKLDTDAPISVVSLRIFKKKGQFWFLVKLVQGQTVATATTKNTQDSLVSGQLPEWPDYSKKSSLVEHI